MVRDALAKHHQEQEQRFLSAGFKPSTPKRARAGKPWEHMDWFIRFQVRGEFTRSIVSSYLVSPPLTESGVNKGIQEIARLLQTPLRSTNSEPKERISKKPVNSSTRPE